MVEFSDCVLTDGVCSEEGCSRRLPMSVPRPFSASFSLLPRLIFFQIPSSLLKNKTATMKTPVPTMTIGQRRVGRMMKRMGSSGLTQRRFRYR